MVWCPGPYSLSMMGLDRMCHHPLEIDPLLGAVIDGDFDDAATLA